MNINKLAGWGLIVLGALNVFREVMLRLTEDAAPGAVYAIITALLFTLGAVLLIRKPIPYGRKAKEHSTGRE